jgi:hypothetical protein
MYFSMKLWENFENRAYAKNKYRCAPVSMGNTFQDLPQLRETVDDTKRYM